MKAFEKPNYRLFEVTYLSPTNNLGSRVRIREPKRFSNDKNISVTLPYDYAIGDIMEQGFKYLVDKGFNIIGRASTEDKYIFFADNWGSDFIEL